jgi:hypothetical protein
MKTNELEVKIAEIISRFSPGGAGEANETRTRFKEIADAVDNAMKGTFYVPETLRTGWISVGAYVASHLDREQAIGAARALGDMQIRESAKELSRALEACPVLGAAVRGAFKNTMLDLDAALKREPGKPDEMALRLWARRMATVN